MKSADKKVGPASRGSLFLIILFLAKMAEHETEKLYRTKSTSWYNPVSWLPTFPPEVWRRTSMQALAQAEKKILGVLWNLMDHRFVPVLNGTSALRTVVMNQHSQHTPLVMVHGMGSGVGLWLLNYRPLAANRPLYAFDVLGFGRSSRPHFSSDSGLVEDNMVQSIEDWREAMGLDQFILLGHSLGGYISAAYALKHPKRIRHLILVDPWGFPECPPDFEKKTTIPTYVKVIAKMLQPFNPLSILRALGPVGPRLILNFRGDLVKKFQPVTESQEIIANYIYHLNAQTPSGEVAFKSLSHGLGWAKRPMINRVEDIDPTLPTTFIFGSRSWIDSSIGWQAKYKRHDSYVDVQVVKMSGHHVYADNFEDFNKRVVRVCRLVDEKLDLNTNQVMSAYRQLRQSSIDMTMLAQKARRKRVLSEGDLDVHIVDRQERLGDRITTQIGLSSMPEETDVEDSGMHPTDLASQQSSEDHVTFSLNYDQSEAPTNEEIIVGSLGGPSEDQDMQEKED